MPLQSVMGGRHNLVFGQSLKVSSPTSTLSPSLYVSEIYREGESVLVGLLTLRDRPKTRLCRPPIAAGFLLQFLCCLKDDMIEVLCFLRAHFLKETEPKK